MANQKCMDENPALTAVCTGAVSTDVINYTLATTATQFSNVGDYPIAVTLGANNYVVSTNGILSVTQKYCCNSSRWQIKVYGMKILRLLLWLLVL
jgi:hypothetical protein